MACNRYDQEEDWGFGDEMADIDGLNIQDVDIEYQEDDGNSDCGDSCTI